MPEGPRSRRPSSNKPGRPGGRSGPPRGKPGSSGASGPRDRGRPSYGRPGPGGRPQRGAGPRPAPFAAERVDFARETVLQRLSAQARVFPDLDIAPLDTSSLSPLDAAFAHAVYDSVIRRWLTLEAVISLRLEEGEWERLESKMKACLLVGAAQILFMDRVPMHAAVDGCVRWAKNSIRPGAAGMVNAILRRTAELVARGADERPLRNARWEDRREEIPLEDGASLALMDAVMPADPLQRLAAATSHPINLLRALSRTMPMRDVRALALHGVARPPTILNTAHMRRDLEHAGGLPLTPDLASAHESPGHHVWKGSHEQLVALFASRNDVWVQDPASSLAVQSASDLTPGVVIDLCAGQGTKTRQLAYTFPEAKIIATDIHEQRRQTLARVFEGHPRVTVIPFADLGQWNEKADLVLIDAPCTNTGVLARRAEARYRFDDARSKELAGVQRQIVADAVRLLAPGGKRGAAGAAQRGRILYSTCSLDPLENEDIIAWADRWHSLSPTRVNRRAPRGGPGEPPERYSDGSFAALLG